MILRYNGELKNNINKITNVANQLETNKTTSSIDKMPQNIEAEQNLIGSILFDNKVLEEINKGN